MYACSGILFNHESPRRGLEFVTRKITDGVARIKLGLAKELRLGNLDAQRDWGFAGDYVRAMWLMLQQAHAGRLRGRDRTRRTASCASCARSPSRTWVWTGKRTSWWIHAMRPAEVDLLLGDADKARRVLDWQPTFSFHDLVTGMVDGDMARLAPLADRSAAPTP